MKNNVWKKIDYGDGYYISNDGRVKSTKGKRPIILKPSIGGDGYKMVTLSRNGILKSFRIHRLVAEYFIDNPDCLPCVNHKDEDKTNNHLDNLEWCTKEYNDNYGTRNQRLADKLSTPLFAINIDDGTTMSFKSMREAERCGYFCAGILAFLNGNARHYKRYEWYRCKKGE